MRARILQSLLFGGFGLVAMSCNNDVSITEQENVAPLVSIDTPDDGDSVTEGSSVDFRATVADDNGLGDIQVVVWTSSIDGEMGDADAVLPDANGASRVAATLSEGLHTITVTVTDLAGEQASDSIGLTVEAAAQLPLAEIVSPGAFDEFDMGSTVDFSGVVSDPNQEPESLTAVWTIQNNTSGDTFGPYSALAGTGGITTSRLENAPEGNYLITLEVDDDDLNHAEDSVYIVIVDPRDRDDDNDGWTPNQGDCDDNNSDSYPGNAELCDGIDNDCNGIIDDKDVDTDNHIDLNCNLYSGTLPVDDCDDDDATVHPLAPEISDGIDNDCNGIADDSTPTYDNDGDCFCIGPDACTGSSNSACTTLDTGDCNDNDANIDPVDDDNDGASECAGDCDDDNAALSAADNDNDGFSTCANDCDDTDAALTPVDIDQDGFSTCDGDCDDSPGSCGSDCFPSNTDADVCNGDDEDCDGSTDEDPERVWYPDADGDGFISTADFTYACDDPDGPGANWISGTTANDCDDDPNACGADCFPNNGAADICDTYNQDCDANVDEDADIVWYHDADLDGFTDSTDTQLACDDPDLTGGEWLAAPTAEEDCDDDPTACGADCFPNNTDPDVCDSQNQDCDADLDEDANIPWYHDADLDGYTVSSDITYACADPGAEWLAAPSAAEDCDDNPVACGADCYPTNTDPDICDDYNQDCDADLDEDPDTVWYVDLDGDGWTDNSSAVTQCDAPSSDWTDIASGSTDCDDDPNACGADCYPTNTNPDVCDNQNQDCDSDLDEDPEVDWFIDADGDGATAGSAVFACTSPGGSYLADASNTPDCDDDVNACGAGCFPGNSALDICDGQNQDCDNWVDEDIDTVWYQDADGDGFTGTVTQTACEDIDGNDNEWLAAPTTDVDCDDGTRVTDCGADCYPGNTNPDVCDGDNQDCDNFTDEDPNTPYYHDADGDQFTNNSDIQFACADPDGLTGLEWRDTPTTNDCDDDTNACGAGCYPQNSNPDVCDGYDQDCSGTADEDPDITWYQDADGDGYTGTSTQLACQDPDDTGTEWLGSATTTDCQDTGSGAALAWPGNSAADICDNINQDCDANTDENPDLDWYEDADGDGYTGTNVQYACEDPDLGGNTWQPDAEGDCDDDTNACGTACNPGIGTDGCDSYNNDCDLTTDEDPDTIWYADLDEDDWTDVDNTQLSCTDPGVKWLSSATTDDCDDGDSGLNHNDTDTDGFSTCGGDCRPGDINSYPNAPELCDGINNDCDGVTDESPDADGDGWEVCEGDCNDTNGSGFTTNPAANDHPDANYVDLNCDGIDGDLATDIFVDHVLGNDSQGNVGEPDTPYKTIGAAIAAATAGDDILVSTDGTYDIGTSTLDFKQGVDVYGGYSSASSWSRSADLAQVFSGEIGASADSITQATEVAQLQVFASDADAYGESSYGMWVRDTTALSLVDCEFSSGAGYIGSPGSDGLDGDPGSKGDNGQNGCSNCNNQGAGGAGGAGCKSGGKGGNGGAQGNNGGARGDNGNADDSGGEGGGGGGGDNNWCPGCAGGGSGSGGTSTGGDAGVDGS
ncbi:MAG: hypothetical protein KC912_18580, partial [Proteobacteria bacterium]|nr:hypothetical protein [Pseudomonadota bacterium]